jgi:PPM family protein phosphatase
MEKSVRSSIVTPPLAYPGRLCLDAFGLSDPGLECENNQDAYLVAAEAGLLAVADGVGGGPAGEVASRLAVDIVRTAIGDRELSGPPAVPALAEAVRFANRRVCEAAHEDPLCTGMATTLTALLIQHQRAALVHVGDSRAYRLRGRRLERLTTDHTVAQALLQAGRITPEEAKRSGVRHVITRALGSKDGIEVDARLVQAAPGDLFLLSTDGLHDVTDDDELAAILLSDPDLTSVAEELVRSALDRGGPDNVTVVLARVV